MPDRENIAVYLNDHLAGSVAALGLLDRLLSRVDDEEFVRVLSELRDDIVEDKESLRAVMRRLGVSESRLRKLAATAAQKLSSIKFRLTPSEEGELHVLHALDSLSLGIEGKKTLWEALSSASDEDSDLRQTSYGDLLARADEQQRSLEELRDRAARRALAR